MTQEIKDKLEQVADEYWNKHDGIAAIDFKAGAQTILENPHEWRLHPEGSVKEMGKLVMKLQSQLAKYREVLGRIEKGEIGYKKIAKEALKQEETK